MYKYKAVSILDNKIIQGESRENKKEIRERLEAEGYYLLDINRKYSFKSLFFRKMSNKELYIFLSKFSILLSSNIHLIEALVILKDGMKKEKEREALSNVIYSINSGKKLSFAMEKEDIFPGFLINIVRLGEESGRLSSLFKEASQHYKEKANLEFKIKNALVYPGILLIIISIVISFFLTYIIPNFLGLYESYNAELPKATRFLISMSSFLINNKKELLLGLLIVLFVLIISRKNDSCLYKKDWVLFLLPISSKIVEYTSIVYFSKIMYLLLDNGFNIYRSVEIGIKVIPNRYIREELFSLLKNLEEGNFLFNGLRDLNIFNYNFISLVEIGEKSGNLSEAFYLSNEFHYEILVNFLDNLTKLIEPVMLIIISLVVGFLVISIALPMFNLVDIII